MGYFRLQQRIRILPGVHINLSKRGPPVSLGGPGASFNIGRRGTRTTLGLPGTGLSYIERGAVAQGFIAPATQPAPGLGKVALDLCHLRLLYCGRSQPRAPKRSHAPRGKESKPARDQTATNPLSQNGRGLRPARITGARHGPRPPGRAERRRSYGEMGNDPVVCSRREAGY